MCWSNTVPNACWHSATWTLIMIVRPQNRVLKSIVWTPLHAPSYQHWSACGACHTFPTSTEVAKVASEHTIYGNGLKATDTKLFFVVVCMNTVAGMEI